MLSITISKSGQPANTINFDKREITIGRTPSNDVRIPEPGVSSSHARILYTDGSLTLIDLDSTNGTFVNGQRIQGPQMVQPGDDVYVCSHKLGFALDGAGASPGAPVVPAPGGPPMPVGMGAPLPVGVGSPPAPMGGPPLPVGVSGSPPPMGGPPLPVGVSGSPPPMGGPPLPVGVSGSPPALGGPPLPVGVGAPPPLGGPPAPETGAPPPLPGPPGAPPPSIPGPAPRPDPSMPPPLGGPGPSSAPPVLAVPSAAGIGGPVPAKSPGEPPTMPPMMPGGSPAPIASAPLSVPPPPSAPPPGPDPAPLDASPPSLPSPASMDAPPVLDAPEPLEGPPAMGDAPTQDPPSPSGPPSMEESELQGPPPPISPPEPMAAPSAVEPPGPPPPVAEAPPAVGTPEPPGSPPPEPPGPPPPVAAPEPEPAVAPPPAASVPVPAMPGPPPPQPRDSSKPQTPSTSAPGMAGKIETPTTGPDMPKDGPQNKVVIGSQSPVRTGATMMADALSREDYPAPDSPGAAAVASWVAPPVSAAAPAAGAPRPGALQGLAEEEKITEACTQVFAAAVASLSERPGLAEDELRAQLRNGLQDFAAHAPGLDVQGTAGFLFEELRGRGPLGPILADPQVHEIALRGPTSATVTRAGQNAAAEVRFTSPDAMAWVLGHLAGRPFDPTRPVLEGTTADGVRLSAVHHSIAADGPVARLRKSGAAPAQPKLSQLVASGTLSDPCAKLLASATAAGLRVLIVGGPGARTQPLLGALTFLTPDEHTVIVRPGHEHGATPPGATVLQSARAQAMPSLVDGALTLQPQRLVIDGISGPEAAVAVSALGRGLDGAILSVQASDCMTGLQRLATLASTASLGADPHAQLQAVAQVVDLVVALGRFGDGRTRVTQVAQPRQSPTSAPTVTDLLTLDPASRGWTPTAALAAFTNGLQARGF